MDVIWLPIGIRVGYLFLAGFLFFLIRGFIFKRWVRNAWREGFIFQYVNFTLIGGFLWVIYKYPVWTGLRHNLTPFVALLIEDTFNLILLLLYFVIYLYNSFRFEYNQARGLFNSFWNRAVSYLRQNGYRWLLVLNVLILLRLDNFYIPLIPKGFPRFGQILMESLVVAIFLLLQLLVLYLRKLNMVEAGPELKAIVRDVAKTLGVKVKVIRIWRLEGVCNAFATGVFRKSIFVSERLLQIANPDDLKMIIGHECAHFKRRHLLIRVVYIMVLLYVGLFLTDTYPKLDWLFYLFAGIAGLLVYRAISRVQELQADRLAAETLGNGEKMAGALARVFGMGSRSHGIFGFVSRLLASHPEARLRQERLIEMKNDEA